MTNNYTPYSGGVVSSINASVDYLHAHRHSVRIITFQFLDHHDDPEYVVRIASIHNWQYKKMYLTVPHTYQTIIDEQIKQFKPDIIHVHHPFLLGKAVLKSKYKKDIPLIFTHHTQYHQYAHYTGILSPVTKRVVRGIVKRFCNEVDLVIAPSTGVQTMLRSDGVTRRISVLPSGLQNFFLPTKKPVIRPKIQEDVQLLYVGRLAQEKNVQILFDVVSQLSIPFRLTIVGYGSEVEFLQQRAYEHYRFSQKQVQFIPKQEPKQLVNHYTQADFFLFPSLSDTQALVLAEAMAQGCPVIAVPGMGQQDIIKQGLNGFIVPDAYTMARKIELIAADNLLFTRLQHNAWITAHKYDMEYIGARLVALYTDTLNFPNF